MLCSRFRRDPAPPLPLFECTDPDTGYPTTVDPVELLQKKFLPVPAPPKPPAPPPMPEFPPPGFEPPRRDYSYGGGGAFLCHACGQEGHKARDCPNGGDGASPRGLKRPAVRVNYEDVDAPKTAEVVVEYGDELSVAAPPPKKKKKKGKKGTPKKIAAAAEAGEEEEE